MRCYVLFQFLNLLCQLSYPTQVDARTLNESVIPLSILPPYQNSYPADNFSTVGTNMRRAGRRAGSTNPSSSQQTPTSIFTQPRGIGKLTKQIIDVTVILRRQIRPLLRAGLLIARSGRRAGRRAGRRSGRRTSRRTSRCGSR